MAAHEFSLPDYTQILPSDDESISRFAKIIATRFNPSPLFNAFATEQDNVPPPYPAQFSFSRRLIHFEPGITLLAKNGAILVQSGDWSAVAMWLPPGYSGPSFGQARKFTSSLTEEFKEKLTRVEHQLLAVSSPESRGSDAPKMDSVSVMRPTYHLAFLARNPDKAAVPGAISAVMRPFLRRAREEKIPAWLDAMNINGVEVYKHYGFRLVETVRVGIGSHNADGWPQQDGDGIPVWVMVYDKHLNGTITTSTTTSM